MTQLHFQSGFDTVLDISDYRWRQRANLMPEAILINSPDLVAQGYGITCQATRTTGNQQASRKFCQAKVRCEGNANNRVQDYVHSVCLEHQDRSLTGNLGSGGRSQVG